MSDINVSIEKVERIDKHPNADKLEIATILGTQTLVQIGSFKAGDLAVFFPPDMILPEPVAIGLGVKAYLKHGNRIAATRLRGTPSYGFIQQVPEPLVGKAVGTDVSDYYGAVKYEPPIRRSQLRNGQAKVRDKMMNFPEYTSIQHHWKNHSIIEEGLPVRITEKIHGTNSRIGLIKVDGEWQFVGGSHHCVKNQFSNECYYSTLAAEVQHNVYWEPLQYENILHMLTDICDETNEVVVYGELFGPGVQDLDYGVPSGQLGYRVFDMMINGKYVDWDVLETWCNVYEVELVPVLYVGPFSLDVLRELTYGPTTFNPACKFKGREGCVVTPLVEQTCHIGRMILKSVSADYLDRKGAKDEGEIFDEDEEVVDNE
jgi:RNA ligase (TIGR02306 family)